MNTTLDSLLDYILDIFIEKNYHTSTATDKLSQISSILQDSDLCHPTLYAGIDGKSHTGKALTILTYVEKIFKGGEYEERETLKPKVDSKYKKEDEFLIVLANNREEPSYMDYLKLIVKDKKIKILGHDEFDKVPSFLIDLVLFTGGEDVDPTLYREELGKHTVINKERDKLEREVYYRFENSPKLGICRGLK